MRFDPESLAVKSVMTGCCTANHDRSYHQDLFPSETESIFPDFIILKPLISERRTIILIYDLLSGSLCGILQRLVPFFCTEDLELNDIRIRVSGPVFRNKGEIKSAASCLTIRDNTVPAEKAHHHTGCQSMEEIFRTIGFA